MNDKSIISEFAKKISDRGLWLPSSITLKENQIGFITKQIKKFFN